MWHVLICHEQLPRYIDLPLALALNDRQSVQPEVFNRQVRSTILKRE